MAEYCVVFVDSDGWSFKEMEPVFDQLEFAVREARIRCGQSGLPVLGVADRIESKLVWRTDGKSVEIPFKFQIWPTD